MEEIRFTLSTEAVDEILSRPTRIEIDFANRLSERDQDDPKNATNFLDEALQIKMEFGHLEHQSFIALKKRYLNPEVVDQPSAQILPFIRREHRSEVEMPNLTIKGRPPKTKTRARNQPRPNQFFKNR